MVFSKNQRILEEGFTISQNLDLASREDPSERRPQVAVCSVFD